MKTKIILAVLIIAALMSCQKQTPLKKIGKSDLKTFNDSVSYSIGLDIGRRLSAQKIDIVPTVFLQGMIDSKNDSLSLLTKQEIRGVLRRFQKVMRDKQIKAQKELAEKNKAEGEKFLAENKKKPGVITLPNGIQYKVIKSGNGKSPTINDKVEVNYRGKFINGTEFDNSYKRGKPLTTKVTGVIKGWTEILQKMKEGDEWEVYIPSELAYGKSGKGRIAPNTTLIFDINLLKVIKK